MKITFIRHSAFLVETERFYCLFDYFDGELPPITEEKPLLCLASHAHADHFSAKLFSAVASHEDTQFLLSRDIRPTAQRLEKWGATERQAERVREVRRDERLTLGIGGEDISIHALRSTDVGTAFVLRFGGTCVYHAGDLNWWHWDGGTKEENNNMAALYKRAIEPLCGERIDLAFVPLDPRLENGYDKGLAYLLEKANVKRVFPMHMWGDFSCIERFRREHSALLGGAELMDISQNGQSWVLD